MEILHIRLNRTYGQRRIRPRHGESAMMQRMCLYVRNDNHTCDIRAPCAYHVR